MSLTEELTAKRNAAAVNIPQEKYAVMKASTEALIAGELSKKTLKVGDDFPSFELPNATGKTIHSSDLLKGSALVVSFYRGGWCPYCNMELRALQQILPQLKASDVELVAISPETPDNSLSTSEKNELSFEVLSDIDNAFAKQLGLVFQMPEDLREVYHSFKIDVVKHNGNEDYELPMPATFVIDKTGKVLYAFAPEDYTERLDPVKILEILA